MSARRYDSLRKLRAGEHVELEGIEFRHVPGEIEPGDWYVGERNAGPKLSTCSEIKLGCVYGTPPWSIYPFYIGECVHVEPIIELGEMPEIDYAQAKSDMPEKMPDNYVVCSICGNAWDTLDPCAPCNASRGPISA